jgi:hypothetical protein
MRAQRLAASFGSASIACLFLGGCVYWTEPLNTSVIDSITRTPVGGARVAAWPDGRENEAKTFQADASGNIDIPSLRFWLPLPGDPGLAWPLAMRVEAEGYEPLETTRLQDKNPITLTPSSRGADHD